MELMGALAEFVLRETDHCVYCDDGRDLTVDHIRPLHAGGLAVPLNLTILCRSHNQIKSCYWPWHGYHPFPGHDDEATARKILCAELDWMADASGDRQLAGLFDDGDVWGPWMERELIGRRPGWWFPFPAVSEEEAAAILAATYPEDGVCGLHLQT